MIRLIIDAINNTNGTYNQELDQSLITFGRSKSCHIVLDAPEISRRHFIIKFEKDAYIIIDESSRHGTYLDGHRLNPQESYSLGFEHKITVPGFVIGFWFDGQKPKMERTTVVARKLLDELLVEKIHPRECPSLCSRSGEYHFKFVEEKSSFLLGTLAKADFVVRHDHIEKSHLSFIRDINGIRLIPLSGHEVFVDNVPIKEPQILSHGAIVKLFDLEFIYREHEDLVESNVPTKSPDDKQENVIDLPTNLHQNEHHNKTNKQYNYKALDRLFLVTFLLVLFGISTIFF